MLGEENYTLYRPRQCDGSPLVQVFQKCPSVVVSQHRTKSNVNNVLCGGKRKEYMKDVETD